MIASWEPVQRCRFSEERTTSENGWITQKKVMETRTGILKNVVVIRNILIVLLVFYHAFAIYSGAWTPIEGFPEIPFYYWLDLLSYAFMLPLFVLVSGYVFGYQVRVKGQSKLQANNLFRSKFKRLIIPCIVFDFLYILLFGNINQPAYITAYDLVNGVGHLWFLPMLFWCFIGVWLIEKLRLKTRFTILVLLFAAFCSFLPLPFRMGIAMYYMPYFYTGYILQKNEISLDMLYTKKSAYITTLAFLVLFPLLTLLKDKLGTHEGETIETKIINYVSQTALSMIYVVAGIAMTFSLVGLYLKKHSVSKWMVQIGALSFGVYLFQQFILKGLYNHTSLPSLLGCYCLPWVGLFIALFGSLLISYMLRKTRIGRALIG